MELFIIRREFVLVRTAVDDLYHVVLLDLCKVGALLASLSLEANSVTDLESGRREALALCLLAYLLT